MGEIQKNKKQERDNEMLELHEVEFPEDAEIERTKNVKH